MFQKSKLPIIDILKVIGVVLVPLFLFLIRDIILMFLVALILALTLTRPVNWLQSKKIPRLIGALLIYLLVLAAFAFLVYLIFPPFFSQLSHLALNLPDYIDQAQRLFIVFQKSQSQELSQTLQKALELAGEKLGSLASGFFPALRSIFGRLFYTIFVVVISFYLVLQGPHLKRDFLRLMPGRYQERVSRLTNRVQKKLRRWLYGQLFLCFVVGVMTFIGLYVMGVRYALFLAIIAGALEVVPSIGPVLSVIPAALLAFFQSPILALLVILFYVGVQQLENHLIVPQVMRRAVGLNPILVIIALLVGLELGGILGALLAVPLFAAVGELIQELMRKK